jgi:hypothetical protein
MGSEIMSTIPVLGNLSFQLPARKKGLSHL